MGEVGVASDRPRRHHFDSLLPLEGTRNNMRKTRTMMETVLSLLTAFSVVMIVYIHTFSFELLNQSQLTSEVF